MKSAELRSVELTHATRANARLFAITILCIAALTIVGFRIFHLRPTAEATPVGTNPDASGIHLTEATRTVLNALPARVEIRFYNLLDPGSVPESTQAFAQRVSELLAAFETEAQGNLEIVRITARTGAHAKAARDDGIPGFNRDQGETCYFGLVAQSEGRRESLPQFFPEWEPALEFDLARLLQRVTSRPPAVRLAADADPAAEQAVRAAIPNIAATTLEEGRNLLRDAALQEFSRATQNMAEAIADAQRITTAAQQGKLVAEREALARELRTLQLAQAERLKEITARLDNQLAAWERLKAQVR